MNAVRQILQQVRPLCIPLVGRSAWGCKQKQLLFTREQASHIHWTPRRGLHSAKPALGVMDSLRSTYDNIREGAEEKRQRQMFEVQMRFLSDGDRPIDGNCFLDIIEALKEAAGIGGFRENLPWVQSNPLLGELKDQIALIQAMTPAERSNPSSLTISALKRISRASVQSMDKVEATITQIHTMRNIQKWMVKRQIAGLPLPSNAKQLQAMLAEPGSGLSKKPMPGGRNQRPRPGVRH